MKLIKKLLLTLILLLVLAIVIAYAGIQTTLGTSWISQWMSNNTRYHLSIEKIRHSPLNPLQLKLLGISLSLADQTTVLAAKTVSLDFNLPGSSDRSILHRVSLQDGFLNLQANHMSTLPIQSEQLQLHNINLDFTDSKWHLKGTGVNAGIHPLQPARTHLLGENSQFQLSANTLSLNGIQAQHVLFQGTVKQGILSLNNFGANIAQGELTGQAQQTVDGSWEINNLRMSHLRWQSTRTLHQLWQQLARLPVLHIKRFDLLDAKLEGPDWLFDDLDFTLQNMTFQDGKWLAQEGNVNLNAITLVVNKMQLTDPILKLDVSPDAVSIKQFTARWEGGLLHSNGTWWNQSKTLQLDELTLVALEYSLPTNWRILWWQPLPEWLQRISIQKLTANRNLVIDTHPGFPFQMTQLDAYGRQLLLVKDRQWGIWQGELTLNASAATFNKVDLRHPSLKLSSDNQQLTLSEFSSFIQDGLIEATASMALQANQPFNLQLNGRSVVFDFLQQWGWRSNGLSGRGNILLDLRGEAAAPVPLRQTLQGSLSATEAQGNTVHQTMKNGEILSETPIITPNTFIQ